MLETALKTDNAFCTLTYEDSKLPVLTTSTGLELPTLVPKHLQDWLKRLRAAIQPSRIRYYAVGEYGDETFRPHYHVALFGYPTCLYERTRSVRNTSRPDAANCCHHCDVVHQTWGHGDVLLGTLEVGSAQYLAGYITKKMTRRDDPRLLERDPEFARMSLRPGIGQPFMHEVAKTFTDLNLDKTQADVPSALRHGARTMPLGRYLRRQLRQLTGKDPNAPASEIRKYEDQVLPLLKAAQADPENPSLKAQIIKHNEGATLSMKARAKIFKSKRTI